MAIADRNPLELLRELLEDDRRAGIPWQPEQFAHTVGLVCRETRSRAWLWPIIGTYHAWADAYCGRRAGALEGFSLERVDRSLVDGGRVANGPPTA